MIFYLQSSDKSQFINSRFCKFLQYCNAIETKNSTSLWWLTERVVTFLALLKTPYAKSWSSSVMRISLIKLQSLESLRNLLQTIAIVLRMKWVGKYWNTFNHISSGNNLVDITVWSIPEKNRTGNRTVWKFSNFYHYKNFGLFQPWKICCKTPYKNNHYFECACIFMWTWSISILRREKYGEPLDSGKRWFFKKS